MARIQPLATADQWRAFQEGPGSALLFKFSTTCPISKQAHERFVAWAARVPEESVRLGLVRVIEERPLSAAMAKELDVTHQSPQAILMRDGRVLWHASHYAITEASLSAALASPEQAVSHSTTLAGARAEQKAQQVGQPAR